MAGKPGIKNAIGNKGGGRKSAYQELRDAKFLNEVFHKPQEADEIKKRLASGKFSVSDVMVLKALGGNERFIEKMFEKLFPDKIESTTKDKTIEDILADAQIIEPIPEPKPVLANKDTDGGADKDSKQEGQDSTAKVQPSPGQVQQGDDKPKLDTESKTEGVQHTDPGKTPDKVPDKTE